MGGVRKLLVCDFVQAGPVTSINGKRGGADACKVGRAWSERHYILDAVGKAVVQKVGKRGGIVAREGRMGEEFDDVGGCYAVFRHAHVAELPGCGMSKVVVSEHCGESRNKRGPFAKDGGSGEVNI